MKNKRRRRARASGGRSHDVVKGWMDRGTRLWTVRSGLCIFVVISEWVGTVFGVVASQVYAVVRWCTVTVTMVARQTAR